MNVLILQYTTTTMMITRTTASSYRALFRGVSSSSSGVFNSTRSITYNYNNNNNNNNNSNNDSNKYKSINQLFESNQGRNEFVGLCQQVANYTVMRQKVGRTMKPNIYIQSPGQIFEPNLPVPLTKILVTPSSWIDTIRFYYRTYGSIGVIKSKLKALTQDQFAVKSFVEQAKEIFINLNKAIANSDTDEVKELATIHYYSILAKNTQFDKVDGKKNNVKSEWTCELDKPKMLWIRAGQIRTTAAGGMEYFGQICVEFSGKQSLTRTDTKKNIIISQVKDAEFKDVYVFERCLSSLPSSWRVCQTVDTQQQ
ncbi:hypothetical protein DFA_07513 [Cavenderia fasciculata]|uniref:Large ribosomal subunit protein mL45 n=1 Tax=Cavenderia fasciculata TaxID=261658 RepID=F4PWM5_CACFS|nr:uncharacterized protein DFA_07513 [Cavenderia fasciculata]EGG20389.1 hypothetical protein DFA_07513 [Cavenderia fasciculata]|eukprot:XP_004367372.1 hypothetical protein DFA_07513 [Cavenderia fasciculata]